ncbi:hypothetical protein BGX26_005453 [Mortierella sp. AD094]|nr:hypothetical protein BGX26_005453 [Mortierella sp. AD094]
MSDNNDTSSTSTANPTGQTVDPVHQLLQGNNGQPLTAEQRNERREALLKRQRESREKAQQLSQAARANANAGSNPAPAVASAPTTATPTPATTVIPATSAPIATPAPVAVAPAADAPIRENMVQQAVSFLSSPSVQSAEESKKIQFLEKKGLTSKEIELAKARIAGNASAPAVNVTPQSQQQPYQPSPAPASYSPVPPPVPPRTYAPVQTYAQPMYIPQQQQVAPVDPNAFKKKLVIAMLISGGVTALAAIFVQRAIYPMVRGITGARQKLAVSQAELLNMLKDRFLGYKEYLLSLHLGSNNPPVKKIKDTKTTIEEVEELVGTGSKGDAEKKATEKKTTSVTTTATATSSPNPSTVKQLDAFSKKLESHANNLNFEELKATRAVTQDLAEYITKETYAFTSSIAYPTSRYYGYNMAGAAASGKGGLSDPTTPESALKSEIRSLKGLLLNWRNFPVAKETGANGAAALPNLVQQQ